MKVFGFSFVRYFIIDIPMIIAIITPYIMAPKNPAITLKIDAIITAVIIVYMNFDEIISFQPSERANTISLPSFFKYLDEVISSTSTNGDIMCINILITYENNEIFAFVEPIVENISVGIAAVKDSIVSTIITDINNNAPKST